MKNYLLFLIPFAAITVVLILILTGHTIAPATKTTVAHMAVSGMTEAEVAELFE